jgi:hypothetical protein
MKWLPFFLEQFSPQPSPIVKNAPGPGPARNAKCTESRPRAQRGVLQSHFQNALSGMGCKKCRKRQMTFAATVWGLRAIYCSRMRKNRRGPSNS